MARIPRPVVQAVIPGTPAWEVGIRPGDKLMAINGRPVRDILDYQFLQAEEELELTVERPGQGQFTLRVVKDPDEDLGVDFGGKATFDGVYTCHNRCIFCFVHQQPRGLRPTLNLMDDDYRLSFLHGNFITLTDLPEEHWQRIIEQRLSPLYISVHTTDDDLRAFIMGTEAARGIMAKLRRLAESGIRFHTQMVVMPGLNDGEVLDRSIADLLTLGPEALLSIAVVPVGLTRYRDKLYPLRTYTPEEARQMLAQLEAWHKRLIPEWGFPVVYPSDEFYILAGREVPPASFYGSFDQLENGVGMVRLFLDELKQVGPRLPDRLPEPRRVTVVTGMLARGVLQRAVDRLNQVEGLQVDLLPVENEFYGPTVTVAGLLTGRDMLMALAEKEDLGDLVILPAVAFRDGDGRTLDNYTLPMIQEKLGGVAVATAGSPLELAELATGGRLKSGGRRRFKLRRELRFTLGAAEPGYYGFTSPFGDKKTR
ncbi:MAG: DUF512 domain-containing protein [Firmicutes bacterium]|nr:DUF512 domain-containing protein [Bacillota bacterium]